jgi:Tol biopolymer transport system component
MDRRPRLGNALLLATSVLAALGLAACGGSSGSKPAEIAFESDRGGGFDIYVMHSDGSGVKRLTTTTPKEKLRTPSERGAFFPHWSPDGSRLAFQVAAPEQVFGDIAVARADGGGKARLLTPARHEDAFPSWSPDGGRIVFASQRDGTPQIYVMQADGTGQKQLTADWDAAFSPAWSPDGKLIAFSCGKNDRAGVCVMSPDGSGVRQVTQARGADIVGDWSPDSEKIAFSGVRFTAP